MEPSLVEFYEEYKKQNENIRINMYKKVEHRPKRINSFCCSTLREIQPSITWGRMNMMMDRSTRSATLVSRRLRGSATGYRWISFRENQRSYWSSGFIGRCIPLSWEDSEGMPVFVDIEKNCTCQGTKTNNRYKRQNYHAYFHCNEHFTSSLK